MADPALNKALLEFYGPTITSVIEVCTSGLMITHCVCPDAMSGHSLDFDRTSMKIDRTQSNTVSHNKINIITMSEQVLRFTKILSFG